MKIEIRNRYTKKVIVSGEAESLKKLVEKNKGTLREAILQGAILREANLQGANLRETKIDIKQKDEIIKSLGIRVEE